MFAIRGLDGLGGSTSARLAGQHPLFLVMRQVTSGRLGRPHAIVSLRFSADLSHNQGQRSVHPLPELRKPVIHADPAEMPACRFPVFYTVEEAQERARQKNQPILVLFATRRGGVGGCHRY